MNKLTPKNRETPSADSMTQGFRFGEIKWFGGFNSKTGVNNSYGFIFSLNEDVYFHRAQTSSSPISLVAGAKVVFLLTKDMKGKARASFVRVLSELPDADLVTLLIETKDLAAEDALTIATLRSTIAPCESEVLHAVRALSNIVPSPSSLKPFWTKFPPVSPRDPFFEYAPMDAKSEMFRALSKMSDADLVALLKGMNDVAAEDVLTIATLRRTIAPCKNEVLQAVRTLSGIVPSPHVLERFWTRFPPVSPRDPFFEYAPMAAKSKTFQHFYAPFLRVLRSMFDSVNEVTGSLKADTEYSELNEDDRRLAAYWAEGQNEAVLAKMLSARVAEKATRKFYEGVSNTVEDISITQLEGGHGNWITHDLLVNFSTAIDVKNARRPINSKQFYVEHTVPRFKLDREGNDVRVAAILSPYLNLGFINDPGSIPAKLRIPQNDITFLGETSRADLAQLTSAFSSEYLEVVRRHERTFPHWAFGYPDYWYQKLQANICQATNGCDWPSVDAWEYILDSAERLSAVPALCVMGRPLPSAISAGLASWQTQLYSKLQTLIGSPPSLPAIFFVILTDFLTAVRKNRSDFTPTGYLTLLYADKCIHPLGAIDPLRLIRNLVNTLSTLWDHRAKSNLKRFSSFRFGGLGILQGRENDQREWTTLVAYCGGTVYETDESGTVIMTPEGQPQSTKGKCGHTPIVIGINRSCPSCRKLICDKCGFCSVRCREQSFRALADERINTPAPSKDQLRSTSITADRKMPNWESIPLEAYEDEFRKGKPGLR